jgi:ketosteroid isomerase-like protein
MKTKNASMIDLPAAVAAYWAAANVGDRAAAAGCFAADAVVQDEGKTYRGPEAIAGWVEHTTQAAHPMVEPLRSAAEAGRLLVTAKVSGAFPGSPVELDFEFTLADGKIAKLEIK